MVPPYSHRVSRVRRYSGSSWMLPVFAYETLTLFGRPSHVVLLTLHNSVRCPNPEKISSLGLASSAFARHYLRNLGWFLFLALLRCFSSGGSPRTPILFNARWLIFYQPGFPIRISMDLWLLSPTHGFSQIAASFVGSWCQGIPLTLFVAWPLLIPMFESFGSCKFFLDDKIKIVVFTLKS